MRRPILFAVTAFALGAIPIGFWTHALVLMFDAYLGKQNLFPHIAVILLISPMAFGGLLMAIGAILMPYWLLVGRTIVTMGAAGVILYGTGWLLLMTSAYFSMTEWERARSELSSVVSYSVPYLLYVLAHFALIPMIWVFLRPTRQASTSP